MERYNKWERMMIEKGRAIGYAEGLAEIYSQLMATGKITLSDLSEVTGRSEESLQSDIDAWNKRRIHS